MITVIKINLNHSAGRAARLEAFRNRVRWTYFGIVVGLLALGAIALGYENYRLDKIIAAKQAQINNIKLQIQELRKKGKNLSRRDILAMADLESKRILWARKLQALSRLAPHDMALTGLVYKENRLFISGILRVFQDQREFDIIDQFIERLRTDPTFSQDFTKIKFSKFSRLTLLNQDIVSFEIQAYLKNAAPKRTKVAKRKV